MIVSCLNLFRLISKLSNSPLLSEISRISLKRMQSISSDSFERESRSIYSRSAPRMDIQRSSLLLFFSIPPIPKFQHSSRRLQLLSLLAVLITKPSSIFSIAKSKIFTLFGEMRKMFFRHLQRVISILSSSMR